MIISGLVLLGLCFGSFINALVWRVYKQSENSHYKTKKSPNKYSITKGRSMCVECGHILSAKDLIPIFSWVYLRGKCRYCSKKISIQYPLVETITAILFVTSYIYWPNEVVGLEIAIFGAWLIMVVGLVSLVIYDLRWMLLPNIILFKLYIVALIYVFLNVLFIGHFTQQLLDVLIAIAIGGGLFYILFQISKGRWIGGGDVKLGFMLGAICLTPANAFVMLFLASLLGVFSIVPGMITKKVNRNTRIPFGPFLILSTIIVVLFGNEVVNWYLSKVLMLY